MNDTALADIRKLSQLRAHLEGFAAHHAALQMEENPSNSNPFKGILSDIRASIDKEDYSAFRQADFRLHETIVSLSAVPMLRECWMAIWRKLSVFHHTSFEECWPDLHTLEREHAYLVDSIILKDPAAAEDAARHHIEAVWFRMAEFNVENDDSHALQRAEAYLAFHFTSPLSLKDVAENAAYTSPGNLSRLFRRRYGIGFQAYLKKLRLEKAAELLTTTRLPISRIAYHVGYRDFSRFGQHFKRSYGVPPSHWRQQAREQIAE